MKVWKAPVGLPGLFVYKSRDYLKANGYYQMTQYRYFIDMDVGLSYN
jgi:hypothetical protein